MRYINLNLYTPHNEWQIQADIHTQTIVALTDKQKRNYVNLPNNKHWNEEVFLEQLKDLGKRKCWYSEARSEVALYVDHFRPKLKIVRILNSYPYNEGGTRPRDMGYYWLAYNHLNFRISNNYSNARKLTYFPLQQGTLSIDTYPTGDITPEIPMLLDPCVETDVDLIMYNLLYATPTYTIVENEHNYHRAKISIIAYALNERTLEKLRKKTLKMCNELIIKGDTEYRNNENVPFSITCSKLVEMLSPEAEFSKMIKQRLSNTNYNWINDIVLDEAINEGYI